MRENTPPRAPEIEEDEGEIIILDHDDPPMDDDDDDDEEDEMAFLVNNRQEIYDRILADLEAERRRTPVEDVSELTFSKHAKPVYGCALHPEYDMAATGGEDDKAYVWNTKTGEVLHEFDNHRDTITDVHFSYDGKHLAIGDMAGELEVLRFNESGTELRRVWEYSMGDMTWMRWHRGANVLIAGSDNGEIYVWRIPSGDCKILPAIGEKCEDGALSGDGKKLYASYSNGGVKLWDLKQGIILMEVDKQHPLAHTEAVTAVACAKDSSIYMSGGQDEKLVFSSHNGPVASVNTAGPVECVAFAPSSDLKMAASGTLHGEIAIWDFSKCSLRTICEHPEIDDGVTQMMWLSDYTLLVGTMLGNIYGYDARSGLRKFTLTGHMGIIYDMQYNARNNILLTVSDDHVAKIFKLPEISD